MLDGLRVVNFRGISRAELAPFGALNVLVGTNNSGKSTCLEALLLLSEALEGRSNQIVSPLTFVMTRRGDAGNTAVDALFTNRKERSFTLGRLKTTELVVRQPNPADPTIFQAMPSGAQFRIGFPHGPPPLFYSGPKAVFLDVDRARNQSGLLEEALSLAEEAGERPKMLALLRPLLPTIADIRIHVRDRPVAFIEETDGSNWPILSAGDGFTRLALMASRLAAASGRTVLIEEPEAFQHPGSLLQVARLLWESVNSDIQIFIATHSLEFIDSLVATAGDKLGTLEMFRLRLEGRVLASARLNGTEVKMRREDLSEDLRR